LNRRETILSNIQRRCSIDPETECWEWQGPTSGNGRGGGYPRMSLDGQTVAVHRVVFICINGYVSSRKQIDHVCRNRLCCNPDHLEMVTARENCRRREKAKGEDN